MVNLGNLGWNWLVNGFFQHYDLILADSRIVCLGGISELVTEYICLINIHQKKYIYICLIKSIWEIWIQNISMNCSIALVVFISQKCKRVFLEKYA